MDESQLWSTPTRHFPTGRSTIHKKKTEAWLKENMEFWPKDFWPPSSPDLNPLDYSIWAYVQAKACERSHPSVGALKASITKAWNLSETEVWIFAFFYGTYYRYIIAIDLF